MVSTTDHMLAQPPASGAESAQQGQIVSGILRSWFPSISAWLEREETRRKQRDCYHALLGRDDHMLRDLGVTRLDLVHYLERLDGR